MVGVSEAGPKRGDVCETKFDILHKEGLWPRCSLILMVNDLIEIHIIVCEVVYTSKKF